MTLDAETAAIGITILSAVWWAARDRQKIADERKADRQELARLRWRVRDEENALDLLMVATLHRHYIPRFRELDEVGPAVPELSEKDGPA